MNKNLLKLVLVLLIATLGSSSLATITVASPGSPAGASLLTTKAQKKAQAKQDAQQRKADAEAEKQVRKCMANGTLPCNPTVTVFWASISDPNFCQFGVEVTGFAEGPLAIQTTYDGFPQNNFFTISVGPDGTGSGQGISFGLISYGQYGVIIAGQAYLMPIVGVACP